MNYTQITVNGQNYEFTDYGSNFTAYKLNADGTHDEDYRLDVQWDDWCPSAEDVHCYEDVTEWHKEMASFCEDEAEPIIAMEAWGAKWDDIFSALKEAE